MSGYFKIIRYADAPLGARAPALTRSGRYAYIGPEARFTKGVRSLSEAAQADCIPFPSVAAALGALRDSAVDAAMAPLENSVEGAVRSTLWELVSAYPLRIAAEIHIRIELALGAAALRTRPGDIKTLLRHSHALRNGCADGSRWRSSKTCRRHPSRRRAVVKAGLRSRLAPVPSLSGRVQFAQGLSPFQG